MRSLAKRLIAFDSGGGKSSRSKGSDFFRVCEKLRPQLATLVGNEAFRALLAHAHALACAEVPTLRAVHVRADGRLEMAEQIPAQNDAHQFLEGRVVLVARLLELLVAFIGENLTVMLVRQVWPKMALKNLDLDYGGKK